MIEMPGGRTIKAARTLLGWTAKQLADAAGIDASTLSRLEAGGITAVSGRVYDAVINALKKAGVEIEGDTLRLTKKPRR
jgi:transcriptional regulator with XRE-family HTH domain